MEIGLYTVPNGLTKTSNLFSFNLFPMESEKHDPIVNSDELWLIFVSENLGINSVRKIFMQQSYLKNFDTLFVEGLQIG